MREGAREYGGTRVRGYGSAGVREGGRQRGRKGRRQRGREGGREAGREGGREGRGLRPSYRYASAGSENTQISELSGDNVTPSGCVPVTSNESTMVPFLVVLATVLLSCERISNVSVDASYLGEGPRVC